MIYALTKHVLIARGKPLLLYQIVEEIFNVGAETVYWAIDCEEAEYPHRTIEASIQIPSVACDIDCCNWLSR